MNRDTALEVRPLAPLGAEVTGLDLRQRLDAAAVAAVVAAWRAHQVLVFRGQELSEEDQVAFTERLGPLGVQRRPTMPSAKSARERHPAVTLVSNIRENGWPIGYPHDGAMWFHSDLCYTAAPQKATLLYAVELPSVGGNTLFADMYAAHDRLPDDLRRALAGKKALHVNALDLENRPRRRRDMNGIPHHAHPALVTHPETGRKALFVNRLMTVRIEGYTDPQSEALLERLFAIAEDPALVYEHVWRPGDLVLWDNRCVTHARTAFPETERRLLRRTTVAGARLA